MPRGPFEQADLIGLDQLDCLASVLLSQAEDRFPYEPILGLMAEKGWLGQQTKKGFYASDQASASFESGIAGTDRGSEAPLASRRRADPQGSEDQADGCRAPHCRPYRERIGLVFARGGSSLSEESLEPGPGADRLGAAPSTARSSTPASVGAQIWILDDLEKLRPVSWPTLQAMPDPPGRDHGLKSGYQA